MCFWLLALKTNCGLSAMPQLDKKLVCRLIRRGTSWQEDKNLGLNLSNSTSTTQKPNHQCLWLCTLWLVRINLPTKYVSPRWDHWLGEEAFLQRPFHMGVLGVLSLFNSIWIFPFYHKNCFETKKNWNQMKVVESLASEAFPLSTNHPRCRRDALECRWSGANVARNAWKVPTSYLQLDISWFNPRCPLSPPKRVHKKIFGTKASNYQLLIWNKQSWQSGIIPCFKLYHPTHQAFLYMYIYIYCDCLWARSHLFWKRHSRIQIQHWHWLLWKEYKGLTFELLTFIAEQFHLQFHNGFSMVTFFMLQSLGQSPSLPLWIGTQVVW